MSKIIYLTQALPKPGSAVMLYTYPPATALFHNYVYVNAGFREGYAYWAQALMMFACLSVLLKPLSFKHYRVAMIVMVLFMLFIYQFGFGFDVLMVDGLLASLFAALIGLYFALDNHSPLQFFWLFPVMCLLILVKSAGLLLMFIAASLFLTDQALLSITRKGFTSSRILTLILVGLLLPALVYGVHFTWANHLAAIHALAPFESRVSLANIVSVLLGSGSALQKLVLHKYAHAVYALLFESMYRNRLLILIACSLVTYFTLRDRPKEQCRSFLVTFFVIFIGGVVYTLGLLILYLFYFSSYEAKELASFHRYMNIYFLAASLISFFWFIKSLSFDDLTFRCMKFASLWGSVYIVGVLGGIAFYAFFIGPLIPANREALKHIVALFSDVFFTVSMACMLLWFFCYKKTNKHFALPSLQVFRDNLAALSQSSLAYCILVLAVLFAFLPSLPRLRAFASFGPLTERRVKVKALISDMNKHVDLKGNVFFIYQDSTGYEHFIFLYELAPYETNTWCWNLRLSGEKRTPWKCGGTSQKFIDKLDGYQYLLVAHATSAFWEFNSDYLAPVADASVPHLYKIENNEPLKLIY